MYMAILFIQHVKNEGPGIFKQVLDELDIPSRNIKPFSNEHLSLSTDCKGIIIYTGS